MAEPYIKKDREANLIRIEGDPSVIFAEEPMRMLRTVGVAAKTGCDLHKSIHAAFLEKTRLLDGVETADIRDAFVEIITAPCVGKGLRMLAGGDLMPHILGEALAAGMRKRELEQFAILAENIDKTKPIANRRLGLFYLCFDGDRGLAAMKRLNYDAETVQHITDAVQLSVKMFFIANKQEFKRFLISCGRARYEYLEGLAKAQRIVYDLSDVKIMNRNYMMEDMKQKGEPIYVEDLVIDAEDLMRAGIADREKSEALLRMLIDVVHKDPCLNTKKDLLAHAQKFAKNKLSAAFRGVYWIK